MRLAFILLLALIACSGQTSVYGDYNDTMRGTCSAQGAQPVTHYSHGGWTSDCSEALPE